MFFEQKKSKNLSSLKKYKLHCNEMQNQKVAHLHKHHQKQQRMAEENCYFASKKIKCGHKISNKKHSIECGESSTQPI